MKKIHWAQMSRGGTDVLNEFLVRLDELNEHARDLDETVVVRRVWELASELIDALAGDDPPRTLSITRRIEALATDAELARPEPSAVNNSRPLLAAGTGETEAEEKSAQEAPPGEPPAPAETRKKCKRCGKEKPLDEWNFSRHARTADGWHTTCRNCLSAGQRKDRLPEAGTQGERKEKEGSDARDQAEPETEGRCANGESCVHYPSLKAPVPLNGGNKGPLCFACVERNRTQTSPGK
jgi:hypothetical protein